MGRLLAAGERASIFNVRFTLRDEAEVKALESAEHVFGWIEAHRTPEERAAVMVAVVFPAILSDMLHCLYEALETSRKAKLNVSYMLLRKPIQESLYVLEAVIVDRAGFAQKLTEDPLKLGSQRAGGYEAHRKNIENVLNVVGNDGRFDAGYLAQLRYDKSVEDSFDGICNKAIHLFTSRGAIATEKMNINFIFSDWESKGTQWAHLYSRLPYLLAYTYEIVEYVCAGIAPTSPEYLDEIRRRIAAHAILWGGTNEDSYRDQRLEAFITKHREWLTRHCVERGFRVPTENDLVRLIAEGALPGETRWALWRRMRLFQIGAEASGSAGISWLSKLQRMFGIRPFI